MAGILPKNVLRQDLNIQWRKIGVASILNSY